MTMANRILITAFLLLLATGRTASAATGAAQIQVSVEVVANCRILVTNLAFGAYDPMMQNATDPLDGTANLSVLCTKDLRASVLIDDDGSGARQMRSPDSQVSYALFSDSARTRVWGTGANAIQVIGNGSTPREMTVYGRVAPSQVVPAGLYTDAVTARVDF